MDITLSQEGEVCIIAMAGRMDATTTAKFGETARDLIAQGKQCLLVDMGGLEYISSAGLRDILGLVKACKSTSGKLAFCGLQPMVAEVFRISGFTTILNVQESRELAVAFLNS